MTKKIHIFKTGVHTPMSGKPIDFTEAIVKQIATGFDAKNSAPIVVGHPKDNSPAFGWVKSLSFSDGNLYASLKDVNPEFSELVKKGTYKKISASFYAPNSPANPVKGQYSLKHIGFLGGKPPAVKGLEGIQFADDDVLTVEFADFEAPHGLSEIFRNLKNWFIEEKGLETADQIFPEWMVNTIARAVEKQHTSSFSEEELQGGIVPVVKNEQKEDTMSEQEIKDQKDALAKQQKDLDVRQTKMDADRDFAEAKQSVDGFVADGKVLPAEAEGLAQFMAGLDTDVVEFSDGDSTTSKTPSDFIKGFIKGLPKRLPNAGELSVENTSFVANEANDIALAAKKIVADSDGTISFVEAIAQVKVKN